MSLRRFARFVLGYNLAVIVWGGFVRASGSGAGCGRHWPLCNGTVVPREPAIATIIELTHRLTSGIALLLVAALVVVVFRAVPRGHRLRWAAGWSAIFIVVEALVGAGLVLLELVGGNDSALRAGYLAVHLANTFGLLAFLTLTAHWAGRPALEGAQRNASWRIFGATTLVAILIVAMTGAVTALGDTLFPAGSLREGMAQDTSETAHFLLRLRVIHPALAVGTALIAIALAIRVLRRPETDPAHPAARWLIGLVMAQLSVGVINLVLLVPIATQLLHLFVADLVWIAAVVLIAELRDLPVADGARG